MLLGVAAHFGGSMTHGEGYLVEYAPGFVKALAGHEASAKSVVPTPSGTAAATEAEPLVFQNVVLPVLNEKCTRCHGDGATKGSLRVDGFDALMRGGKSGAAVTAGDSARSLIVRRITAALSEEGHMPPESKPQLTTDEVD